MKITLCNVATLILIKCIITTIIIINNYLADCLKLMPYLYTTILMFLISVGLSFNFEVKKFEMHPLEIELWLIDSKFNALTTALQDY